MVESGVWMQTCSHDLTYSSADASCEHVYNFTELAKRSQQSISSEKNERKQHV